MYTIADVFSDNTPEFFDGASFRLVWKDRLESVLSSIGYTKEVAEVERYHGGKQGLLVVLRDKRGLNEVNEHIELLRVLCGRLQTMADSAGVAIMCTVVDCRPYTGHILITE